MAKKILCFCFLLTSVLLKGQNYVADSSFNFTGVKNFTYYNSIDRSYGCAVQDDQKIVIVGLSKNNGTGSFELCFARFLTNGSLDNSFGINCTTKLSMGNQGSIGGMTP